MRGKLGFFELFGGVGTRFKLQIGESSSSSNFSSKYNSALDAVKDILFAKIGFGFDSKNFGMLFDYRLSLDTFYQIPNRGAMALLSGPITISAVVNLF